MYVNILWLQLSNKKQEHFIQFHKTGNWIFG